MTRTKTRPRCEAQLRHGVCISPQLDETENPYCVKHQSWVNKPQKNCLKCGAPIPMYRNANTKYCGMSCRCGYGNLRTSKNTLICQRCGNEFAATRQQYQQKKKYCSTRCLTEYQEEQAEQQRAEGVAFWQKHPRYIENNGGV